MVQNSSGINISRKSVHQELHGMGFYSCAACQHVLRVSAEDLDCRKCKT